MDNQNNSLVLTDYAKDFLRESTKWTKFLAIVGFIGIGLMVVAALLMGIFSLFMSDNMNGARHFPSGIISILYLIMAGLYYLPVYYLFKYSSETKKALDSNDSDLLEEGLENLKSHHKFLGITMIIILSLYLLLIVIGIFAGLFAAASL